jgi:hypothetical protein
MLGLTESELTALDSQTKAKLFAETRNKYFSAGADFVLDSITELPALITMIG